MFNNQVIFEFKKMAEDLITTEDVITLIQKNFGLSDAKNARWKVALRKIIEEAGDRYRVSVKFANTESLLNFIRKTKLKASVSINMWETNDNIVYVMLIVSYK